MKYIQSFDSVNEANKGKVHRAAKKGSYPAVVVVVQDGKVIHQEPVSTPDIAPATFNVMQEKYPKALLHLEDNTGKRLFSESLVTEAKNTIGLAFKEEQDYLDFKEFVAEQPRGAIRKNIGFDSKTKSWNVEMDVKVLDSIYGEGTPSDKKSGWYGGLPDDFESVIIESVTEGEDTIGGLNKMANTDLERIADYADMIKDRMSQGQTLDAWMYSKISDSVKNLNSVHDTMDGNDGVNEDSNFDSVVTEAMDINDPVLVAFRRTRAIMELPKFKPAEVKSRRISFDKYMIRLDLQADIAEDIKNKAEEMAQTLRDMEQEAEPEGGVMADKYGSIMMKQEKEYTQLKAKKAKIDAKIEKYKMS